MKWLGHILSSEVIDHDQRRESIESSTLTNHILAVAHGVQKKIKIRLNRQGGSGQVWTQDAHKNQGQANVQRLTGVE